MAHGTQFPVGPVPGGGEPDDGFQAMGEASGRTLRIIREAIAGGETSPMSPIEAVFLFDDALGPLRDLLVAVPELLAAAKAGPVRADIQARTDELARLARQLGEARRELDAATAAQQETSARLAELETLRVEVAELRRREQLAAVLSELEEQRDVVEQRLAVLRELTDQPEKVIAAGTGELVVLAGQRRSLLAGRTGDTLAAADEALRSLAHEEDQARAGQERLDTAQRRLTEAQERRVRLEAEHNGLLAQLAAHAKAEGAIAAALAPSAGRAAAAADPVGQLQATLDGITSQLDEVDTALREALNSSQTDYNREHEVLGWADQPAN